MAFTAFYFSSLHLISSLLLFPPIAAAIGINYGQIANNLPSPENVVPLVRSIGASRLKLYDANPKVLRAFANTSVEFVVGLGNEYLAKMRDPEAAQDWVRANIQAYLPATKITCINVGNEVLTFNQTSLSDALLPAMRSVHAALVSFGLDKQVTVTTAHSLAILETSYPPSAGAFRRDLNTYLSSILSFLSKANSPFLINAYPYFAYKDDPKRVPLDYVLFQPNSGTVDPVSHLRYDNMLFAMIDAVHYALASIGCKRLPIHISETGWPSKGDPDEAGATTENARKYNGNLIKLIAAKNGTPAMPNLDLNIYVFALFNENMKPGPASERNYGLFKPDCTAAYPLGLAGVNTVGNTSTGGIPGNTVPRPTSSQALPESPTGSSGYMSISFATVDRFCWAGFVLICSLSWIIMH